MESIMSNSLKNKVCLIKGAASGIGFGIAKRYLSDGAVVIIADLMIEAAEQAVEKLLHDTHNVLPTSAKAIALAMDVTDEVQVNHGVERIVEQFGGIDVLVPNAGIQIINRTEDFAYNDWKKVLAIHLDAPFLLTKACLPYMYSKRSGSIVFIGSVHSKEASKLKSAYVTAKHGLLGLCKTIAKEGAEYGVRANVVCPGFVRTPLVEKQIPEQAKNLGISEQDVIDKVMLVGTVDGEFTTIEDVAEVAHHFAAFSSNALTGQSLIVSHGWYME